MVVEDVEFLNILKGKRVKVTLKTSAYLGVVQRINANKTLILADVRSNNGCKLLGSKMFFGHEILNVEFTNDAATHNGNGQDHRVEEHLNVYKFQPYREKISFDDEDEEEYIDFAVIDEFHEKFGPAIMNIKKQHVIGVGISGVQVYQHGRLCWLQIATKNKVYLFDILLLGARAFKNGLTMILESKHILKVIHDCRAIAGCLFAQFGVKLTCVFDTQVADVMGFYAETGGFLPDRVSTLQEVVSLHLKVPSSQLLSLKMMSQLTKEEREVWQKRPCPVPLLKVMALSVIHLQPLRLVLLDALMTDYMALVDSYLNSSHFQPDELQHVTMESVLELPKELRHLEQMHCEKQEWAAAHYPVTKKGLLDRFNPRTQPPSQTYSAAEQHMQTESDSSEPVPSSTPADVCVCKPLVYPPEVPDAMCGNVTVSPEPETHASVQAPASDLFKQMSCNIPLSAGRGIPFGKDSSMSPLPAIGRGFCLQISQQTPRDPEGDRVTTPIGSSHTKLNTEVKPHHGPDPVANDPPVASSGPISPHSLSFSSTQLFRPFNF